MVIQGVILSIFFVFGVFLACFYPEVGHSLVFFTSLFLVIYFFRLLVLRTKRFDYLSQALCCLVMLILGFYSSFSRFENRRLHQQMLPPVSSQRLIVHLIGLTEKTSSGVKVLARIQKADDPLYQNLKIRLFWRGVDTKTPIGVDSQGRQIALSVGQVWEITSLLRSPAYLYNFDDHVPFKKNWMNDVVFEGFVDQASSSVSVQPKLLQEDCRFGLVWVDCLRQDLREHLSLVLAGHAWSGTILALVVGDTGSIPQTHWDLYSRLGLTHLISISGLHITLFAGLVLWLFKRIFRLIYFTEKKNTLIWIDQNYPKNWVWIPYALSWLSSAIVALMAGFEPPAQRTLVMLGIFCIGKIFFWRVSASFSVLMAMVFCLLFDPTSLVAAGFWFSCVSVWLLIWVDQYQRQHSNNDLSFTKKIKPFLWDSQKSSWLLAPMSLVLFGRFSMVSVVSHLVSIPVMWLLIPFLLFFAVLSYVWASPLLAMAWLWAGMMYVLSPLAQWNQLIIDGNLSWFGLMLVIGGGIFLMLPKQIFPKWMAGFFFLPVWFSLPDSLNQGDLSIEFIDIGQGNSVLLKTANHTLLFDTGPPSSANTLTRRLKNSGLKQIDVLTLSHQDNDHTGGAEHVLKNLTVHRIDSSFSQKWKNQSPNQLKQDCQQGVSWSWDGVFFEYINLPKQLQVNWSDNNRSCVLVVQTGSQKILLAGDIEKEAEFSLFAVLPQHVDVLLVPHHGSHTSSSDVFLKRVEPKYAVVQSGVNNRYHHPHPSVVRRYQQKGTYLFDTAKMGAVRFMIQSNVLTWSCAKENLPDWTGQISHFCLPM